MTSAGTRPSPAPGHSDARAFPPIRFAGAFLSAPGGYPSGRVWAPDASVEAVRTPEDAAAAVDRQLGYGASFIKVTLNSDAGPVLDDDTLSAVVDHAHSRGTTVTAHAEGGGQATRAFRAGVDRLAHTPWTERLDDDLLAAMVAASLVWISTLDIHGWGHYGADFAVASDNLHRFHALGGTVRYGTDLGNGALPVGINVRELRALEAAGIGDDDLVAALVTPVSAPMFGPRISVLPGALKPTSRLAGDGSRHRRNRYQGAPDMTDTTMTATDLDASDPLAGYRDRFVRAWDVAAYLDGNSLGRPLKTSVERLGEFAETAWGGRLIRGWDEEWYELPLTIGDAIGRITLGAAAGQVFVGDSTTVILYKLMRAALDASGGRA